MVMKNVKWLDGADAVGKYILEISFNDGGTGYLKNENYEKITHYYTLFFDCDHVVGMTLYNADGKAIATQSKARAVA
jgi:hypothetical protein